MYEADDEDEEEVTSSWKRHKTAPADDDTIVVVAHRCDSPPAAQELPWGPLYEDVSDEDDDDDDDAIASAPAHDDDEDAIASSPAHEDDDDDDFTFSPASPPLTQRTEDERTTTLSPLSPTTLYVFPDETVVLKPDGGCVRIPDQHTITHPKPSTSTIEDDDDDESAAEQVRKVCFMRIQTNSAQFITHQWRASTPSTVEEVTVDVCRALTATMLSAEFQNIIMKYVRINIRRQP